MKGEEKLGQQVVVEGFISLTRFAQLIFVLTHWQATT
jgi:hypothetical protein